VTRQDDDHRVSCATFTYLAEPADQVLGHLLQVLSPADVLASIRSGTVPARAARAINQAQAAGLRPALARWHAQLPGMLAHAALARHAALTWHAAGGIRLVCPGEPGWPPQLDDLGAARPYALWVRGAADLRASCEKSLAVVGARAATAYGKQAATCIAADLAGQGWAIVSGAAYGIDAAAHHGTLTAGRATVAVLACGPDVPYPRAHAGLLADIAIRGAVVSECPPGRQPSRLRFLARNRIIAALARGTVIIEAAERSGTVATARHASDLARPLMAVPGPVTSATSAGCNVLIREKRAVCVGCAADIIAHMPL
jgi:DNA processing protein